MSALHESVNGILRAKADMNKNALQRIVSNK